MLMGKTKITSRAFGTAWSVLIAVILPQVCFACGNHSLASGNCLHTYLERDFPSIEAVIHPKKQGNRNSTLLLDGPELQDHCDRLMEIVVCLEEELPNCHYYVDFFAFRHLIVSLHSTIGWICAPGHLRDRFRVLLQSFSCLEIRRRQAVVTETKCFNGDIPLNIWQKIIRQEYGIEICSFRKALGSQENCLHEHLQGCSDEGYQAYVAATEIFLSKWCDTLPNYGASTLRNSHLTRSIFLWIFFYLIEVMN